MRSIKTLPKHFIQLLESDSIKKVGRAINGDLQKIVRDFSSLAIKPQGGVELGKYCKSRGLVTDGRKALQHLCAVVLGKKLEKDDNIRTSIWSAPILSAEQRDYAAKDAAVSLEIFWEAYNASKLGKPLTANLINGGLPVNVITSGGKNIAQGELSEFSVGDVVDGIKITKNLAVVKITKVIIPAFIVKSHKNQIIGSFTDKKCVTPLNLLRTRSYDTSNLEQQQKLMPKQAVTSPENHISLEQDLNLVQADDYECDEDLEQNDDDANDELIQINEVEDVSDTCVSGTQCKVLLDAWHAMNRIKLSRKHGARREFGRRFRDVLFVLDSEDKRKVEEVLKKKKTTFDYMLKYKSSWLWERIRRRIPSAEELYPLLKELFNTFGSMVDASTKKPLFDDAANKEAKLILKAVKAGRVSDPVGLQLYYFLRIDQDGLAVYRCARGTNSVEGGVHQNIIRFFCAFNASPRLANCLLQEYRHRHNIKVQYALFEDLFYIIELCPDTQTFSLTF